MPQDRGSDISFRHAWAKAPRPDESVDGSLTGPQWLPLHVHLMDTADIAGRLCEQWLGPGPLAVIAQDVGGEGPAREIVKLAAALHDLGKLTPPFAAQVEDLRNHLQVNGFQFGAIGPAHSKDLRHALAGHVLVHQFLVAAGATDAVAEKFAVIVGGHHGVPPTAGQLRNARQRPDLFGGTEWARAREQLLEFVLAAAGLHNAIHMAASRPLSDASQILISGLVIMADWIASSADLFPLVPRFEQVTESASERGERAWRALGLPRRWEPMPVAADISATDLLRLRFPQLGQVTANPVQELAVQSAREMTEPGLLIIEAVMGVGKTEASLLAAEILAARFGMSGVFFGLPTRATADAMFQRVTRWLDGVPDTSGSPVKSLMLRHGSALLNPDFETIPRQSTGRVGFFDDAELSDVGIDELDQVQGLTPDAIATVVHSWTSQRKRASLADFTVATVDHQLMAALAARHFVLRQLGLSRQIVVLDEVHSADTWMRGFLIRSLQWLGRCRVPVIALSATLPPDLRRDLVQAYERGRRAGMDRPPPPTGHIQPVPQVGRLRPSRPPSTAGPDAVPLPEPPVSDAYPLLTTLAAGKCVQRSVRIAGPQVSVQIRWLKDTAAALSDLVADQLADGGCALVVCNTVPRAVERYRALNQLYPGQVTLAHSRFIAADRLRNDDELRSTFGPPQADDDGRSRPAPSRDHRIVVATQVAEQSLDIDFDLLVTDLAPIDLILQRMGRLHRHQRADTRPPGLRTPQCWVTAFDPAAGPIPERGGDKVYGADGLLRSAALIAEHASGKPIQLPRDVPSLVRRAYSDEPIGPVDWQAAMATAAGDETHRRLITSANAETGTIPPPGRQPSSLVGWLPDPGAATEIDAARQVRQDDGGFEVLLLERAEDGLQLPHHLESGSRQRIPTDVRPTREQARGIARCAVRIPGWVSQFHLNAVIDALNQNYFASWQKDPLLAGQWVLPLDADGTGTLGPLQVSYSTDTGLEITDGRTTEQP